MRKIQFLIFEKLVFQQMDGLFGALIIREFSKEISKDEIFIFSPRLKKLQTLQNDMESNIEVVDINIHQVENYEVNQDEHTVKRIRLINAAALDCPLNIFVNFIPFKLLSVDGGSVKSIDVTSVLLHPGRKQKFIKKDFGRKNGILPA